MAVALSLICLILFTVFSFKILGGGFVNSRTLTLPDYPEYKYMMSPKMMFTIFVIVTGPFFLAPFSLLKYAVYFGILVFLLITGSIKLPKSPIVISYVIFLLWLVICAFRSSQHFESLMLLIKYSLPLFSLALGYSAIENKYDLFYLLKVVSIGALIYAIVCGGYAKTVIYPVYRFASNVILTYAALTDYLSSIFIVPLVLWWWSRNKKWLWVAIIMFGSVILESVRTGLGAMTIAGCLFFLCRYKAASIPFIGAIAAIFIAVILYVPSVNEKFFGEESNVTAEEIVNDNALSLDNIQTSGRKYIWERLENRFYKGHEISGSGLGESTSYMKKNAKEEFMGLRLMHSDYVQMKCDTGLVGLWLFIIFGAISFLYIIPKVWTAEDMTLRIAGALAFGSMGATAFSMAFDNVVSHSMSSMIMPFIFLGMFIKLQNENNDELIFESET